MRSFLHYSCDFYFLLLLTIIVYPPLEIIISCSFFFTRTFFFMSCLVFFNSKSFSTPIRGILLNIFRKLRFYLYLPSTYHTYTLFFIYFFSTSFSFYLPHRSFFLSNFFSLLFSAFFLSLQSFQYVAVILDRPCPHISTHDISHTPQPASKVSPVLHCTALHSILLYSYTRFTHCLTLYFFFQIVCARSVFFSFGWGCHLSSNHR